MTNSKVMSCLLLLFLGMCLLTASQSYGQSTNASLSGTVTDPSNAAIPDAKLSLTNAATGFTSNYVSDGAGQYTFPNLTPGTYNLSVSAKGFESSVQQGLVLSINQSARVDVHLTVGAESQTVTVTGDTSLINYDNPTIEGGISPETLNDMPLTVAGAPRSSISLATMMPGVSTGGSGNAFNSRVNGGIVTGDEALLDGATMTEGYMNQSGMVSLQGDFQMSPDMVSEVKVLSANYDPQYGSTTSGQLIVVSKGGGEQFHGAAFEFLRNDALNATPFGTPYKQKASADKENNYGANLGGPILLPHLHGQNSRMKSYFYFNWEAIKVHGSSNPPTLSIPSLKARNGDFSNFTDAQGKVIPIYNPKTGLPFPNNMIDPALEDPIAKAWMAQLPTPTNNNETNNYLVPHAGQGSLVSTDNVYMFRIDFSLGSSDHFYYTFWRQYSAPNLATNLPKAISDAVPASPENSPIERGNWEHMFSPVMTNHFTIGYLNRNEGYYSLNQGANLPSVSGVANTKYLPTFTFSGFNQLGSTNGPSQITTRPTYAINDVLSRVIGTHTLKAGIEWRNAGGNIHSAGGQGGSFSFSPDTTGISGVNSGNSIASFYLGAVSSANVQFLNVPNRYPRQIGWAFHVGDSWRLNPKLTLSYGVRWDTISPSYEKSDHLSFFDPNGPNDGAIGPNGPLKGRLAFAGKKYGTASYGKRYPEEQHYDWAPRVGVAYSVDSKTVLRAGYGIYFGQAFYPGWGGGMSLDGFNLSDTISEVSNGQGKTNTPAMYLSGGFPTPATTSNISSSFDNGQSPLYRPADGNKRPYSSQWNFTVERELPQNFFVGVSYVGTKGTHLPSQNNPINVLNPFSSNIQAFTSADGLSSKLTDKFGPNDTMVDGVPIPYPGWVQQVSSCGATVAQALLPFPQYCSRLTGLNEGHGNSIYQSLQGRVERHMRNGLYVLGSFTYSRLYTNGSDTVQATNTVGSAGTGVISPFNLKRQRAIAADNVPFNTTIAVVYDLPFGLNKRYLNSGGFTNTFVGGWQVSPIWSYNYGIPFAFGASNCNVVPQFREGCIPGILPGAHVLLHGRNGFNPLKSGGQYINPDAFESIFSQANQNPKFGYTGTGAVVTTIYGPAYQNLDMSLTKNTRITEKVNFQFRANFFNAFNNHYFVNQGGNFGGVGYAFNTSAGATDFGKWNKTVTAPRTIQFAARLEF
ncbi:MAG TPA: carboxypeptidase-like regulatory domain-containing protein [Acidisarcina sp.]|nr:carboxypeptidase-like regulatory domain-containing protein [Acidisarcina sp.]